MVGSKVTAIRMDFFLFFINICYSHSLLSQTFLNLENSFKRKIIKAKWCQNWQFLLRRGLNCPSRKVDFVCVLQISLLGKVGELAEGGFVAMAVGVSDM